MTPSALPPREDRSRPCTDPVDWSWREVATFLGLTFGATWSLHGALALTSEPFSLETPTTALLYLPGLLAPSAAAS